MAEPRGIRYQWAMVSPPHRTERTPRSVVVLTLALGAATLLLSGCGTTLHPPARLSFGGLAQAAAKDEATASATVTALNVSETDGAAADATSGLLGGEGSVMAVLSPRYRLGLSVAPLQAGPEGLFRLGTHEGTTVDLVHGVGGLWFQQGDRAPVTLVTAHAGLLVQTRLRADAHAFVGFRAMWAKDVAWTAKSSDEGTTWLGGGVGLSVASRLAVWTWEFGVQQVDGPATTESVGEGEVVEFANDFRVIMFALTVGLR